MRNPLQLAFDWFTGAQEGATAPPQHPADTDSEKKSRNPSVKRSGGAIKNEVFNPPTARTPPERTVMLEGRPVPYVLARAPRRSIGMRISPDGLQVRAPAWVPLAQIEAALQDKAAWIVRKQAEVQQRRALREAARTDWRHGTRVPLLGREAELVCDPLARSSARRVPVWVDGVPSGLPQALLAPCEGANAEAPPALKLRVGLPADAPADRLQAVVQRWLQQQARLHFTERLAHFAPQLGVRPTRLALSNAATRWGSASADGSIRLHWRLIQLRPALIDYVVVHELSHLRHMDHSPRFWAVVASVLPDHRALRAELRRQALTMSD
jgi:hypothetical protein